MSDAKAPEDAAAWHRRFAAAGNNRAWDLSVQSRSGEKDQEMLNAAHAVEALEAVSNQEEHRIVASTFSHVPKP
jgi:hypothetical protein